MGGGQMVGRYPRSALSCSESSPPNGRHEAATHWSKPGPRSRLSPLGKRLNCVPTHAHGALPREAKHRASIAQPTRMTTLTMAHRLKALTGHGSREDHGILQAVETGVENLVPVRPQTPYAGGLTETAIAASREGEDAQAAMDEYLATARQLPLRQPRRSDEGLLEVCLNEDSRQLMLLEEHIDPEHPEQDAALNGRRLYGTDGDGAVRAWVRGACVCMSPACM